MRPEELKTILKKFKSVKNEVASIQQTLQRLREQVESVRSAISDGLPRSGKTIDIVADAVCRLDKAIEHYRNKMAIYTDQLMECEYLISLCGNEDGRTILREHYINGIEFKDIPILINVSPETMWRYYRNAVKEICCKVDSE